MDQFNKIKVRTTEDDTIGSYIAKKVKKQILDDPRLNEQTGHLDDFLILSDIISKTISDNLIHITKYIIKKNGEI